MNDKFAVDVANALLYTDSTLIAKGKSFIDSALKQELSKMEIKGGWGNKTLFIYNYDKRISADLNSATFEPAFFAVNSGVAIQNKLKNVFKFEEKVTLDKSGKGKLQQKPLDVVFVMFDTKTGMTVNPVGDEITIPSHKGKEVRVTYQYNKTVDTIELNAEELPKNLSLLLEIRIFDKKTGVPTLCQIRIENFKPSGNFDLNLSASQASTSKIQGDAIADEDGHYGSIDLFPGEESEINYAMLAVYPNQIEIEKKDDVNLMVFGLRGGNYAPVLLDSSLLDFKPSSLATVSIDENGTLRGLTAGSTEIVVSLKENKDITGTATVKVADSSASSSLGK